jgi:type II secretory pathway component GspD/PulD (secretin)
MEYFALMKAACRIFATAFLLALTWDGKGEENRPTGVDGQSRNVSSGQTGAGPTNRLQLNFHGVSLDAALDYLSDTAGLIIVKEADPKGTFDFSSKNLLSKEQAIAVVNSVLRRQGYALTCNDRILTVQSIDSVKTADLEVAAGNNPEAVAKSDEVITQVIPVHYANAAQLANNLPLLLPSSASLSANESANSLVLVASKTAIKRMLRIVKALDTSMAAVSSIKVFPLRYADAKQLASVIQQLFSTQTGSGSANNFASFGPPMFGGPTQDSQSSESSGRNSAGLKVVAAADETSNSLIVSASVDSIRSITEIVQQVDRAVTAATELRIFELQHADPVEIADQLGQLFPYNSKTSSGQNQQAPVFGGPPGSGGGPAGFGGPGGPPGFNMDNASTSTGTRAKVSGQVIAVADPRTSSLLVSASSLLMPQIAKMVQELDASSARREVVKVFELQNADAQDVNQILKDLFNRNSSVRNNNNNNQSLLGQNNPLTAREAEQQNNSSSQTTGFGNGSARGGTGSGGAPGGL